jgi:hypothetical protein
MHRQAQISVTVVASGEGNARMTDTPTFGRYAEIPFDHMSNSLLKNPFHAIGDA